MRGSPHQIIYKDAAKKITQNLCQRTHECYSIRAEALSGDANAKRRL